MNKKILTLTLMLLAMLTLTIIPVQAGKAKGEEKLYFQLYMEGTNMPGTEDRSWCSPTKELPPPPLDLGDANLIHIRGQEFWILGDFYVLIGNVEIPLGPYDYSASCDFNWNFKTNDCTLKVRETITFDGGTLEILSVDKIYNVYTPDMYAEGTFVGHGTGALKGVKVAGTSSMTPISPVTSAITREGTVMGWDGL